MSNEDQLSTAWLLVWVTVSRPGTWVAVALPEPRNCDGPFTPQAPVAQGTGRGPAAQAALNANSADKARTEIPPRPNVPRHSCETSVARDFDWGFMLRMLPVP